MPSNAAKKLAAAVSGAETKLGDIKKHGKRIEKDHALALDLWSIGGHHSRLLANQLMKD